MAVRVLDQSPQYFTIDGTELLVGGTITTYLSGTSTLQATYTDATLTTLNSNPLVIDSQGRVPDAWTGIPLTWVLADAMGAIIDTKDSVEAPVEIPNMAGHAGEFLSSDGTSPEWVPVEQVPAMTGQSGKVLSNDGTDPLWINLPAAAAPDIVVAANGVGGITATATAGGAAPVLMIQSGSGTITASGINQANGTVTFATPFSAPPRVSLTLTTASACASGFPVPAATSIGTSGFGASFNNSRDASSGGAITGSVTYHWIAIGLA